MSQTKLARQRPTSAAPHSLSPSFGQWQAGTWRANSESSLTRVPDPLEGYDSRFSVDDVDSAPVVLSSSPLSTSKSRPTWSSTQQKSGRPQSAVRPQLRSSAHAAQQEAFLSWRELMAEMLGDVTQDIVENMGQEFVNAIRVMRRDFDRAVERVSEEVKSAQLPTTQAVTHSTSTLVQELGRVHSELSELHEFNRVDMDFSEIADAIRGNRADMERLVAAVQEDKTYASSSAIADVNLEPILQAIWQSKADLAPVLQKVEERCTKADLQELAQLLPVFAGQNRPEVDLQSVLSAIQEIDLSPLIVAIDEKRLDLDVSELVGAIHEVATGVHAMSESKREVELKQAVRDKITTEAMDTIQEACTKLRKDVQDSRAEVLSAVKRRDAA